MSATLPHISAITAQESDSGRQQGVTERVTMVYKQSPVQCLILWYNTNRQDIMVGITLPERPSTKPQLSLVVIAWFIPTA
jgi:hypothetical protein